MAVFQYVESLRQESESIFAEVVPSGAGWMHTLYAGQVLRIVDLEGNQAVDTLFYDAQYPDNHYSASDTIVGQGNVYLSTGTRLMGTDGEALLTIIADTCGRHDTLGGACSCESNTVRYDFEKRPMHSCRDTFMLLLGEKGGQWTKADLAPNINFFMNVPVTPEGGLRFADGVSSAGRYVEMRAEKNVVVLVSNCPQLNNPCNGWNPTPVKMVVWNG